MSTLLSARAAIDDVHHRSRQKNRISAGRGAQAASEEEVAPQRRCFRLARDSMEAAASETPSSAFSAEARFLFGEPSSAIGFASSLPLIGSVSKPFSACAIAVMAR